MILTGYCDKQNKEYTIDVDGIDATCREDMKNRPIQGIIHCEYGSRNCECNSCSILNAANKQ
jgi:hypothetical protein